MRNKPTIEAGDGFRLLAEDETIREGDDVFDTDYNRWRKWLAGEIRVSETIGGYAIAFRRKIDPAPIAAEEMRATEQAAAASAMPWSDNWEAELARAHGAEYQRKAEEAGRQQAETPTPFSVVYTTGTSSVDEAKRMEAIDQAHKAALELAAHTAKRDWQDKAASQIESMIAEVEKQMSDAEREYLSDMDELKIMRNAYDAALAIVRATE